MVNKERKFILRYLERLRTFIFLPKEYDLRMSSSSEWNYDIPEGGWVGILFMHFKYCLRFSLNHFIRELLQDILRISLGQLVLNSILHFTTFIAQCTENKLKLTSRLFFYTFRVQKSQINGFYQIYCQDGGLSLLSPPSSNKG